MSLARTDVAAAGAPDSVAIGDLDGVHGKDIVVAPVVARQVGVMLNHGDGTFAAMQQYTRRTGVRRASRWTSRSAT